MTRLLRIAVAVVFLPTGAWAQTSAEYAVMGKKVTAVFECAALAQLAGDADEQKRLFTRGYEQGKTFIEALRSGKIEKQDVDQVPVCSSTGQLPISCLDGYGSLIPTTTK